MMYRTVFVTLALVAVTSLTAFAEPKDDLTAAITKTADSPNYSWTSSVEGGFGGGKTTGKTEKDGYTEVTLPMRDQSFDVILKGKKAIIKTDAGWKTPEEITSAQAEGGFSPERFVAMQAQNFQTPLVQAEDAAKKLENVKSETDGFSGNLSEAAAKEMLTFRRRRNANANNPAPEPKDAKVAVRVWTKDGVVTKLQYHATGSISFGGQDRDIDRTTTIELKDVGSTKVDVPADAKKKLEG